MGEEEGQGGEGAGQARGEVGRDWEEGRWAGRTGEWRRRRWVRVVRRVGVWSGDEVTKSWPLRGNGVGRTA